MQCSWYFTSPHFLLSTKQAGFNVWSIHPLFIWSLWLSALHVAYLCPRAITTISHDWICGRQVYYITPMLVLLCRFLLLGHIINYNPGSQQSTLWTIRLSCVVAIWYCQKQFTKRAVQGGGLLNFGPKSLGALYGLIGIFWANRFQLAVK